MLDVELNLVEGLISWTEKTLYPFDQVVLRTAAVVFPQEVGLMNRSAHLLGEICFLDKRRNEMIDLFASFENLYLTLSQQGPYIGHLVDG